MDKDFAARLRGFGPLGLLAVAAILFTGNVIVGPMVVLPIGAMLALTWTWLSETPWAAIGYVRPGSWTRELAAGAVLGSAFKVLMKVIVMPLLGGPAVNPAYHFLAGNTALLPAATWAMVNAGFAEETVFRGYLFERLGRLLGASAAARTATVLATATLFAAAHYTSQGLPGVEQAAVTGLVFGTIYAKAGRLLLLMAAHAAFDLTALALIYWDLEANVAHLVFN